MANPQVIVEFVAQVEDLKKGYETISGHTKSTGDKLKSFGKEALRVAGAAGLGALVFTLHSGVEEYAQAAKVSAQTNAVIKSTGGVARVTAKHVDDLASALLQKSGVDDEAIKSGENMLLTFTNIRNEAGKGNDIFDQATKVMLDMSVALGQDTTQSALQLGKALNDPIQGVTALRRVGVQLTKAQEDQVKAMVASGDVMGAQKVILQELNREFGGSAEAAGKTVPGQLNILKESFNNLAGEIVATIMPALQVLTEFMVKNPKLVKVMTIAVLALAAALVAMNVALTVTAVVSSPITGIVLGVVAAVAALAAVAYLVYTNWNAIWNWLKTNWVTVATIILGPFIAAPLLIAKYHDDIVNAVKAIFNAVYNTVWGIMSGLANIASDALAAVGRAIYSQFDWVFNAAWSMAQAIKDGLFKGLAGIGQAAWNIINNVGEWIGNSFSAIFNWGWGMGATIIQGMQQGISGIAGAVWSVIASVGGTIASQMNSIFNWGWGMGRKIWDGFVAGLRGIGNAIMNAIKAPINAVIGAWNNLRIGAFTINLPKPVPDVKFGGYDLPNLPFLAAGGIVTSPTLAMIGEAGPEMVLPLGASGAPIQVRVFIGDRELTTMIRTEVVTQNNRTAQTLLAGLGA